MLNYLVLDYNLNKIYIVPGRMSLVLCFQHMGNFSFNYQQVSVNNYKDQKSIIYFDLVIILLRKLPGKAH